MDPSRLRMITIWKKGKQLNWQAGVYLPHFASWNNLYAASDKVQCVSKALLELAFYVWHIMLGLLENTSPLKLREYFLLALRTSDVIAVPIAPNSANRWNVLHLATFLQICHNLHRACTKKSLVLPCGEKRLNRLANYTQVNLVI